MAAFLEHGYHGTGIQQVLSQVNVPKGSFYNDFASKEALGAAAIRHYSECFGEKLSDSLNATTDPLAGLRRFFRGLMQDFEGSGFVGGCLIGNLSGELEGSDLCRRALAEAFADFREGVRKALQQAQDQGLVRVDRAAGELADLLTEAWEGALMRMKIERSLAPPRRCLEHLLEDYFQA